VPNRKSTRHAALSAERSQALGERLRDARKRSEVTQEALAQTAGVWPGHIQRIERGVANPTVATLYALADALGVDVRTLLPD
jgi:transcriptional regulator with XRE-family HTH domain